jgi:hypothetical protein
MARFMMLVKASCNREAGRMPAPELVDAVMKYRDELRRAGVLVDVAALHPRAKGARIRFTGGRPTVIDGPFAETREVIGGYWLIEVGSKAEAVEWATRAPHRLDDEAEIELRELFELDDFAPGEAIGRERDQAIGD